MSKQKSNSIYKSKSEKASELKGSAVMLLVVGVIGMVIAVLFLFDKMPIHFTTMGKATCCSVMGVLFGAMIVFGFVSLNSSKMETKLGKEEDKLTEEIDRWIQLNLSAEYIDQGLVSPADEDAVKYYKRSAKIKFLLAQKFMNLDPDYLDDLVEQVYQDFYES